MAKEVVVTKVALVVLDLAGIEGVQVKFEYLET